MICHSVCQAEQVSSEVAVVLSTFRSRSHSFSVAPQWPQMMVSCVGQKTCRLDKIVDWKGYLQKSVQILLLLPRCTPFLPFVATAVIKFKHNFECNRKSMPDDYACTYEL